MSTLNTFREFSSFHEALGFYGVIFFLSLGFFWIIGSAFLKLFRLNISFLGNYANIFISLLLGLVISISVFAIMVTKGKTSMWGILGFVIYGLYLFKRENHTNSNNNTSTINLSDLFNLLALGLVVFIPFSWNKIPFGENLYPGYMGDYLYYADIGEFAFLTGNENIFSVSNLFGKEYQGASPYHFFDIWLNVLLAQIANLPYVSVLETVVWAIFRFILAVGILGIVEKYFKINPLIVCLCTLVLFFAAWYFPIFNNLDFLRYNAKLLQSVADGKKIAATGLFFVAFYIFWIYNYPKAALCFLMAGSFASVGNVMGISGGLFLFGVFKLFQKDSKMGIWIFAISFIGLIFTVLFFKLFGSGFPAIDYDSIIKHLIENPLVKIKFWISYLATGLIYNFLLVGLFCFSIYKLGINILSKNTCQLILILVLILIAGAGAAALFTGEFQDGDQFYMNVYIPTIMLLVITSFIFLKKILNVSPILNYITIAGFALYAAFQGFATFNSEQTNIQFWASNYSKKYLMEIKSTLSNIKNPIGASINIIGPDPFYHKKYYIYNPLGYYLNTIAKGYHTIGLSYYEICTECPGFKFLCDRDHFAFYQYVLKKEKSTISVDSLKIEFIKEFKIDYLIVESGGIIPHGLENSLQLAAKDKTSGESFYLIKN